MYTTMFYIFGLGNPGEEYKETRHNTGRMALEVIRKKYDFPDWEVSKIHKALISEGKIGKTKVMLLEPETFMNKSGESARTVIKTQKDAKNLLVIYDDLDLPIGRLKLSINKSSGGHNGVESIINSVKTENFGRIRIGISPMTPGGKLKKPIGEAEVEKSILGAFKPTEEVELKKVFKRAAESLETIFSEDFSQAMTLFNKQ